jgi:hypothetical protein
MERFSRVISRELGADKGRARQLNVELLKLARCPKG